MFRVNRFLAVAIATSVLLTAAPALADFDPEEGHWVLAATRTRTYFVDASAMGHVLSRSKVEQKEVPLGPGPKIYGPETITSRVPGEHDDGFVPSSSRTTRDGDYLLTYAKRHYSRWDDVSGTKPYTTFSRFALGQRTVSYYLLEWTDPQTGETLSTDDSDPVVGEWQLGNAFDRGIAATGIDPFSRREDKPGDNREILLSRTFSSTQPAAAGAQDGNGQAMSFLSSQTANTAAVKSDGKAIRSLMSADKARASVIQKARGTSSGGITLTNSVSVAGTYQGAGQSSVTVSPAENGTVKVDFTLVTEGGTTLKGSTLAKPGEAWSVQKDGVTVSGLVEANGSQLAIQTSTGAKGVFKRQVD